MSDDDSARDPKRWLYYATEDLRLAEDILSRRHVPPHLACCHAQQAAEKALKAALIEASVDFPKTHDLDHLRDLLPPDSAFCSIRVDLPSLTDWAADARYPDTMPDATREEAGTAVADARAVVEPVQAALQAKADDEGA